MTVDPRVVRIVTDMHAQALARALQNAVNGAPHWRLEAQAVLDRIEWGVPPDPDHRSQEAA
jgi:hypothetical protein